MKTYGIYICALIIVYSQTDTLTWGDSKYGFEFHKTSDVSFKGKHLKLEKFKHIQTKIITELSPDIEVISIRFQADIWGDSFLIINRTNSNFFYMPNHHYAKNYWRKDGKQLASVSSYEGELIRFFDLEKIDFQNDVDLTSDSLLFRIHSEPIYTEKKFSFDAIAVHNIYSDDNKYLDRWPEGKRWLFRFTINTKTFDITQTFVKEILTKN